MTEPKVTPEEARSHGLSASEYQRILDKLGREPSWTELGILSVMWSEHCSYKSSRKHLKGLYTEAPWVLQGPGENAGVIDVADGMAVCFKMESHNHPSYIEPYQGAATGVGGIMRDIFTMGARPIANMNSLRFGRIDAPRMRFLIEGVVAGIGDYGNCMGVPTVGGEIAFDPSYDGNILVNAFTLGALPSDRIFRSAPSGVGSKVVYVGSKTGRDGIHGATMASEEFGAESEAKRPRVQVGDPFTEKRLLEACLELMTEDVIIAIQDMGAAGLTSSSCEMAAKGGLGIEIDVAKVPRREVGMTAYEVMLSESQERMLMVVKPGTEPRVAEIFKRWELDVAVIGEVTDSQKVVIFDGETLKASIPVELLVDDAPIYDRPYQKPADFEARWTLPKLPEGALEPRLLGLLARPTVASKRWVYEQYDWSVRDGTVKGPGAADAAVVRMPGKDLAPQRASMQGVAMAVDMNGRYVALDPFRGAMLGVLEGAANLACVGAKAKALTDCLNFGNPEKPEVMWSFVEALRGMDTAARALQTPVVSGNVSLYNETEGRPILPTPTLGMVGVLPDVRQAVGFGFQNEGDRILLLGDPGALSFAGSELYLMEGLGLCGRPPEPDLEAAKALHALTIQLVREGLAVSAHDLSEGGLLVAVSECCIASRKGLGAQLRLPQGLESTLSSFGEGPSLILVSVRAAACENVLRIAKEAGVLAEDLGEVAGDQLIVEGQLSVPVKTLKDRWEHALERQLNPE